MKDIDQQWWLNNNKTNQQHQPMGPGSSNKTCSSSHNNNNSNKYLFSINEIISNTMHNCRSIISSEVKTIKPPPPPPPSNNYKNRRLHFKLHILLLSTFIFSFSLSSIFFSLYILSLFPSAPNRFLDRHAPHRSCYSMTFFYNKDQIMQPKIDKIKKCNF